MTKCDKGGLGGRLLPKKVWCHLWTPWCTSRRKRFCCSYFTDFCKNVRNCFRHWWCTRVRFLQRWPWIRRTGVNFQLWQQPESIRWCLMYKHVKKSDASTVTGVWTGVRLSNLKKFRIRIQKFWNRIGVGVWKSDPGYICES